MARGLTPVYMSREGLEDSLAEMTRRMSTRRVHCEFVCDNTIALRDNHVATHLYRIAQEAVNNALKHAEATLVIVSLGQTGRTVTLQIEDNGRGFPKVKPPNAGIGLEIMRHRANVIGATLETRSINGKGVTIICTLRESP